MDQSIPYLQPEKIKNNAFELFAEKIEIFKKAFYAGKDLNILGQGLDVELEVLKIIFPFSEEHQKIIKELERQYNLLHEVAYIQANFIFLKFSQENFYISDSRRRFNKVKGVAIGEELEVIKRLENKFISLVKVENERSDTKGKLISLLELGEF